MERYEPRVLTVEMRPHDDFPRPKKGQRLRFVNGEDVYTGTIASVRKKRRDPLGTLIVTVDREVSR